MNKRDETYFAVVAEIERVGGKIDDERQAVGSHRVIYWSLDEKRFQQTVSNYSGNWRARHNAVAEIRAKARGTRK